MADAFLPAAAVFGAASRNVSGIQPGSADASALAADFPRAPVPFPLPDAGFPPSLPVFLLMAHVTPPPPQALLAIVLDHKR
ncbi:MAG: hypothetical protein QM769_08985 [Pseudoxanthomonas sp.]